MTKQLLTSKVALLRVCFKRAKTFCLLASFATFLSSRPAPQQSIPVPNRALTLIEVSPDSPFGVPQGTSGSDPTGRILGILVHPGYGPVRPPECTGRLLF
jgi:hypothetical protein